MCSRVIALADVDADGDLDFAVANQWERSYFFENDAPRSGAFLGLHLRLPLAKGTSTVVRRGHPLSQELSICAIGALVTVQLPDRRILTAQVDGGTGHSGKRAAELHFGLGTLTPNSEVSADIRWRGRDGQLRSRSLSLSPGWYTVSLGDSDAGSDGRFP
jgi:hypothetical protein